MGPRRPPMRAALRRCRKGRMTGSDWREPVRTHVSLGTSMPKITGILKIYPPQRSAGGVWETRSKAEGFPHGTFQGAQRACGCGKPPNEMVWDGASSPGFSMAASRPLGWGRTCPLASVPDMPVRKVSIRRWMARMAEKEPIRVRMGSGISGLSLKVVNRWYGRRSECARGARPCALAGFTPIFAGKDRNVKSEGFYATGSVRFARNFDFIASFDYFNPNKAADFKQNNYIAGVQYWFYPRCRLQAQYTFCNKKGDGQKDSNLIQAQVQVRF